MICNDTQVAVKHLADKYQEVTIGAGITLSGSLVRLFSTGKGETWTIVISGSDGISCIAAAGENWRQIIREPTGPES